MILDRQCRMCGKTVQICVPDAGYAKWQHGACIQDAMPEVSISDREMLISGTCPTCWDMLFPKEDS